MLSVMRDEQWKSVRSAVVPVFASSQLKRFMPTIYECIKDTETELEFIIDRKAGIFDAGRLIGDLMLDIIGRVMFGIRIRSTDEQNNKFVYYCRKALDFTFTDYKLICDAMFPNVMAFAEEYMQRTIFDNDCNEFFKNFASQLRNNPEQRDVTSFLKVLLHGVDSESDSRTETATRKLQKQLDAMDVAGQCFLFLIAGYETTASTITFALHNLANFGEIQEKTFAYIRNFCDTEDDIEYHQILSMAYLEQIMMETLRLYPPTPRFDRECSGDIQIGDICFSKGCIVSIPIFAIHYDEKFYPEPYKFDPERFSKEAMSSRDPLSFLPFGYGPRNCLGRRFAQLEFQCVIASLLLKYRFDTVEKTPVGHLQVLEARGSDRR